MKKKNGLPAGVLTQITKRWDEIGFDWRSGENLAKLMQNVRASFSPTERKEFDAALDEWH